MHLTAEQKQAITTKTSLSVIASAGTGKTTVLTQRFLHIHQERETPIYNILAFTFTEKASREMKKRIVGNHSQQGPLLNISTIHSFCHKLLQKFGSHIELRPDFNIFDEDSLKLWKDQHVSHFINTQLDNKDETLTAFLKYYGYAHLKKTVSHLLSFYLPSLNEDQLQCINQPDEVDVSILTKFLRTIRDFQASLMEEKIHDQLISYDDLEILCLQLFEKHPEILKHLQNQYKHILVDEFQDISPRQFAIIKKLFNPETNEIFIVGDPKQSIYGFRQANSRLFSEMTDIIENHGGKTIYLTQTFRTPIKLQNYFNRVFPQVLSQEIFQKAMTEKDCPESKIFATATPEKRETIQIRHAEYANELSEMIRTLIDSGTKPEEIAILFFAKGPMDIYQEALQEKGIQTVTESSQSFFENPLILTLWHLLNFLAGYRDKITQIGILRNPIFSFSESFIDHLMKSGSENLFSEQTIDLFASQKDRATWTKLTHSLQKWQSLSQTLFATELFETISDEIKPEQDLNEILMVQKFKNIIKSWQNQDLYYLQAVIGLLRSMESIQVPYKSLDGPRDGVRLLTIHGSKGLEFDHVFLVPGTKKPNESSLIIYKENEGFIFKTHDCEYEKTLKYQLEETEVYKTTKEVRTNLEKEELTRLIYVALTRAKKSLYFFTERPSQITIKALEKQPNDTTIIKNYNEWIYWLTETMGDDDITRTWQPNLFPKSSTPPSPIPCSLSPIAN